MGTNKFHSKNKDWYLSTPVTKTLHVDGNRTDSYIENGSPTRPYKSFTNLLNSGVPSSAVVKVAADYYYEDVDLTGLSEVTIVGENTRSGDGTRIVGTVTISGVATKVSLKGIRVQPATDKIALDYVDGDNCYFQDCVFRNPAVGAVQPIIRIGDVATGGGLGTNTPRFYNCSIPMKEAGGVVVQGANLAMVSFDGGYIEADIFMIGAYGILLDGISGSSNITHNISVLAIARSQIGSLTSAVTATPVNSFISLNQATLRANDGVTVGAINLNGTCSYVMGICDYNLATSNFGAGTRIYNSFDRELQNTSAIPGNSVKEALENLDAQSGAGVPTLITPDYIGQIYRDTTNGKTYVAKSLAQGDWEEIGAGGGGSSLVTVGTAGADYNNFDDAIDYLRTLNGGTLVVITDMNFTMTQDKDISYIRIIGDSVASHTFPILMKFGTGSWYGSQFEIEELALVPLQGVFVTLKKDGAIATFQNTAAGFGTIVDCANFQGDIMCFKTKFISTINDSNSACYLSSGSELNCQTPSNVYMDASGKIIAGVPASIVLCAKASNVNNDSSVAGSTVKDALENINNKVAKITYNLPATTIANGEHLQLYRFTVPVGKSVKVWAAGLSSEAGTSVANTKIKIYNETNSVEEYSTNSLYVGGNPIATLALAGKDVSIDVSNDCGVGADLHGFMAISISV